MDDGLAGADDIDTAIKLKKESQELFSRGRFLTYKWNSSELAVLQHINPKLQDVGDTHLIADVKDSTKTLGLQWETNADQFHVTISQAPSAGEITKRTLISDIARVFDVLGWLSPAVIKVKILF